MAAADMKKYALLQRQAKEMLEQNILPFWQNLKDDEYGGFYGLVDFNLNIDKRSMKGCILNSRILWFFSEASVCLGRKDLLDYARHAYAFLKSAFLDKEKGGLYWAVNHDGTVKDGSKHSYNQAFGIYALSAYHKAGGGDEALELAKELVGIIEEKCRDSGGYGEAYDRNFLPSSNEKLSENGVLAHRTMNSLLHILEAYSAYYQLNSCPKTEERIREILEVFKNKVYCPKSRSLQVFFDKDMNSLIDLQSYGHDIEGAWLLDFGAGLLGDEDLVKETGAYTSQLTACVYEKAYHNKSLWNEREKGINDKSRVWWVQAEAVVGFINEFEKQPQKNFYLEAACHIWYYIKEKLVDKRPGSEWFWQLDDEGRPLPEKPIAEPWKCPYHNGRMCFEILRRNPYAAS